MSARRRAVALLGTARNHDEAAAWQARLRAAGISSIARGRRAEGSRERRPAFTGIDLYVSASHLGRSREAMADVIPPDQLGPAAPTFPWVLAAAVAAVPLVLLACVAIFVVLLR